jgi:alpha-ketoglutarate-dependent taurine dioxygenase
MNQQTQTGVMTSTSSSASAQTSPFALEHVAAYQDWRQLKLSQYPDKVEQLVVEVANPMRMSRSEIEKLTQVCSKTNMVIYHSQVNRPQRDDMLTIAAQFGLQQLDNHLCADDMGVSALCDDPDKQKHEYIPYTRKAINWHTDGYYNQATQQIRAMMLHCVEAAKVGGENSLYDHELLYLRLRDQNPDFIQALMQPDAMTIPANSQAGVIIRPALTGPVFSIQPQHGDLHCRYTARTRSIEWKKDDLTLEAVAALESILKDDKASQFTIALQPGQGMITNNVLHTRRCFENGKQDQQRLVYRVRSYNRVLGTHIH